MMKMVNKVKLRVFVKTYLSCKGKCTSNQLAEAFNRIGFEKHDINAHQVASFLKDELNKAHSTTCLHSELKYEVKNNRKVWYL